MNKVVKIGVLGLIVLGAFRVFGMKTLSDKLNLMLTKARIHKIDLTGVTFRTNIVLQNPTKYEMTISKPYIKLTSNGTFLTGTNPLQTTYKIKPLSSTTIQDVEIKLPIIYLTGVSITDLIASLKTKNVTEVGKALKIPLEMQYSVYADNLFYESTPVKLV